MRLTEHFEDTEFACRHCGKSDMDMDFIKKLQIARTSAGTPFIITSGLRCPEYNKEVDAVRGDSSHLRGLAADISTTNSRQRKLILAALIDAGFHRMGIGNNFIHVDDDPEKDSDVIWLYLT